MFKRLFGLAPARDTTVVDALYDQIVAAARQPELYSVWGVPDTPLGRYEMMSLHMVLFLRRAKGAAQPMGDIAQELVDEFFLDVDHSIRELGISDGGVPKRMKKLARMFYGRAKAYGDALDNADMEALAAALTRNVWPDGTQAGDARALAAYAAAAGEVLTRQPAEAISRGELALPAAAGVGRATAA